jgi:putative heme-binding domain-containing protein
LEKDLAHYFRAIDFISGPEKKAALMELLTNDAPENLTVAIETLSRLEDVDLETNPLVKVQVMKVLDQVSGTPRFVDLVSNFKITNQNASLLEFAIHHPNDSSGVEAMRLILASHDLILLTNAVAGANAIEVIKVLGNTGEKQIVPLLTSLLVNTNGDSNLRGEAVRSMAEIQEGAAALLALIKADKLNGNLKFTASTVLNNVRWPEIKTEATTLLPLALGQNSLSFPPISDLLKLRGDVERGAKVFVRDGCIKCHQVNRHGTEVGPNLSEIGSKLGKEALYEAILDPSAGISFGYEAWQIDLKTGDEVFGLIASESQQELVIRGLTGIVTRYDKRNIAKRRQMKTSLMPTGLQQAMSHQDLIDLVEYLYSLKKSEK